MRQHIAIAIAVLMIISMTFAVSTTTVSAAHEQTPEIDETTVKSGIPMVLTITVANAGPAAIENVRITVPAGFADFAPTIKLFEDNIVTLENSTPENVVTLPAGTLIQIPATANVSVIENTLVIIASGTWIYWEPTVYYEAKLTENLSAKIINKTLTTHDGAVVSVDNFTFDIGLDNANTVADIVCTVDNGTARLLTDTQVVRVGDNVVRLPADLRIQLVSQTIVTITADNELTLEKNETVDLDEDNTVNAAGDNTGRIFTATSTATTSTVYTVQPDENVLIMVDNSIVFPAGTQVILENDPIVTLFENTEVIRVAYDNVLMTTGTATAAENQPKNWTQTWTSGQLQADWKGIGENQIASGGSLAFPFAVTTPSTSGDYTIFVRTTDTAGNVTVEEVTVTVDATAPTITTISASPLWAKENTTVTITVTTSESLAKLDNVMAAENNAPENTQISMTPNADNTVWTGTFTTSDNTARDGQGKIYVMGAQFEDLVGNTGATDPTDNFYVDKVKPPTPSVMDSIYGWVDAKKYTNIGEWLIEGNAQDNYLDDVTNTENMTVKIRVGTTTYDLTSGAGGYFYKSITLTEGVQEVGIQYVDKAGNVGTENAENITYDATKPSISITAPADEAVTNDNTPTIKLTIADAVMGIDNNTFDNSENRGYVVWLCWDNDDPIAGLEPKTDPAEDPIKSFAFENDYPDELADGWYKINVAAGDNLQQENVYFRFEIDATAPDMPSLSAANNPVLFDTSVAEPKVQKTTTLVFYGSGLEPSSDVNIYLIDQATGSVISTDTTTATAAGDFSKSLTLAEGKIIRIEVETVDEASNVSSMVAYGYVMVDATAPTVALGTLPDTTDRSSITISGTVTKDSWEDWSDITLTVQLGTGLVPVPITPVSGNDGSYSYSLALAEGSNTIVVQAIDDAGNASIVAHATVERVVTPWAIYAIILVIVALILAAIAIFGGPRIWKR